MKCTWWFVRQNPYYPYISANIISRMTQEKTWDKDRCRIYVLHISFEIETVMNWDLRLVLYLSSWDLFWAAKSLPGKPSYRAYLLFSSILSFFTSGSWLFGCGSKPRMKATQQRVFALWQALIDLQTPATCSDAEFDSLYLYLWYKNK